jgi:hypothetical protein
MGLHPVVPIELGSLSDKDLLILGAAAAVLEDLPDSLEVQGGDNGGPQTRTLHLAYIRHGLSVIIGLRRGID